MRVPRAGGAEPASVDAPGRGVYSAVMRMPGRRSVACPLFALWAAVLASCAGESAAPAAREQAPVPAAVDVAAPVSPPVSTPAAQDRTGTQPQAPVAPSAGKATPPADDPSLTRYVQRLQERVTRLRGLAFKQNLQIRNLDEKALRKRVLEELDEEYPPARMLAVQKAGIRLGFFPERFDLRQTLTDLLTEQIAGFYDPKRKELCLVDKPTAAGLERFAEGMIEMTTGLKARDLYAIHELTHAVQDQHYDLETLPVEIRDNDDLAMAAKAVVEGDATLVMFDALARAMGQTVDDLATQGMTTGGAPFGGKAAAAPEFLKQSLLFPYFAGLVFIQRAKKQGGWARIDALYADLPASTEQVLHPEKFLGAERDVPTVLRWGDLAALPGTDWTMIESNVLGEFGVRIFLKEHGVRIGANRAATGWGGDRYRVYERKGAARVLLLWASTWDTEADAVKMADALGSAMDEKAGEHGVLEGPAPAWRGWRTGEGESAWMRRERADVFLVEGWEGKAAPAVLVDEWRTGLKREELKKVERVPRKPKKKAEDPKAPGAGDPKGGGS
jgi:hypothetical protein